MKKLLTQRYKQKLCYKDPAQALMTRPMTSGCSYDGLADETYSIPLLLDVLGHPHQLSAVAYLFL